MSVHQALQSDKFRVLYMLRSAHDAAGYPFPFSAPHAAKLFDEQTQLPGRTCLVYSPEERAVGVLMASIGHHPFGPFKVAAEVCWWIDEDHRGGVAAGLMMDAYEAWAKENGCTFVSMAALATAPRASVIYRRRKYAEAETHFIKRLSD